MIMRYQRVSPDGQPSSFNNGRGGGGDINGSVNANGALKVPGFEGKGLSRFRSLSKNHQDHISYTLDTIGCGGGDTEKNHHQEEGSGQKAVGGDGLLQWGHRKRSRCSRNENGRIGGGLMVGVTNDCESLSLSSSSIQFLQRKQQLQQATVNVSRRSITNSIMPPPPPTTSNGIPKGSTLKSSSKDNSSVVSPNRRNNLEDRAGGVTNASPTRSIGTVGNGGGRSVSCRSKVRGRRSTLAEKFCRRNPSSAKEEKMNGGLCSSSTSLLQRREAIVDSTTQQSEQVVVSNNTKDDDNNNSIKGTMIAGGGGTGEKANGGGGEANEWPKIFIPLSRKEKEEDFLVMKGTKLPHRPKKRPKTIDRVLQCCSPGMWLSDLTKGRYEVRERKCTKKQKRRGLKGMERVDSDSD